MVAVSDNGRIARLDGCLPPRSHIGGIGPTQGRRLGAQGWEASVTSGGLGLTKRCYRRASRALAADPETSYVVRRLVVVQVPKEA